MLSPWILVASLAAGLAVALAAHGAVTFFLRPRPGRARALDFEFDRRQRLRQASRIYRYAEPLIEWLLRRGPGQNPERLRAIRHALAAADEEIPWEAGEYLAACQVQALLFGLGTALLVLFFFGSGWLALVGAAGMAYVRQRRLLRRLFV